MIKFLLERPVAVIMAFLAFCIIGVAGLFNIPVSLLPDIPIPEITVQINSDNTSARELENTVVSTLRHRLSQTGRLRDISCETRDGSALIRLSFKYGTNTDLAFIEVNEKIDAAMNYLPKTVERPRVIKASATDIPVLYINLTLASDSNYVKTNEAGFLNLSEFAENVVKRRIEQLPEVSMVDISGLMKKQVTIIPDVNKIEIAGISYSDIESAFNSNNIEPGSMKVRDGYYEYNIRFSTVLRTIDDIRNVFIRKNDRIYKLSDVADINYTSVKESGMALYKGKRCIRMAIIKQSDENMDDMQSALDEVLNDLKVNHPDIEFNTTENQTELLDYTISNLQQNLILAFLFVWLISVVFMKDIKSPVIIGISMIVSVIISLLLFYLLHLSINVVSLTGLILASGNMIDNSIVVTDNIGQYKRKGLDLKNSCIKGTNEVIGPMLSSAFSSISVFAPLIFLSGIAGALFFDQALSVTIGLLVSYVTGIVLLPVLYKLFFNGSNKAKSVKTAKTEKTSTVELIYHKGIEWTFSNKKLVSISMLVVLPLCVLLFMVIPKEKMPDLHQNDFIVDIDWNDNIHVKDNLLRTENLLKYLDTFLVEQTGLVGEQQFLLNKERNKTSSETELYLKVDDAGKIGAIRSKIDNYLNSNYKGAIATFAPSGTVFEKIFTTGEPELIVECYPVNRSHSPEAKEIRDFADKLWLQTGQKPDGISFDKQMNLHINQEKLLQHNIPYSVVYQTLKTAFRENAFATLRSYQQYMPVVMGDEDFTVDEILRNTLIPVGDSDGRMTKFTLDRFVDVTVSEDIKTIISGKAGEHIPVTFQKAEKPESVIKAALNISSSEKKWETGFSGSYFSNKKMINELIIILLISIMLMYFILVAQFENFKQPLIILMEIPIDLAASLALLMVCGHTLNLMSAIGMVVTCGIVINDSILKVDVMNQLRKEGLNLMEAIHEAGRRRLKAILMTSFTSIVCMVPLLFTNDLGSELEKPLALATIGGMLIGTPVSLFVVPLLYWWIYKKEEKI